MKEKLKKRISPFFTIYKNGEKYIVFAESSGLIELNEIEFNNLFSINSDELMDIRMLIPEKEEKINVFAINIILTAQHLVNLYVSINDLPKYENTLIISTNINSLLSINDELLKFEKVLVSYAMDPYRFFIYVMKKNNPCIYEIYLWLKNSRLILEIKVDGKVIVEASLKLNEFAEFLLLGLSKLLLNSSKYDGKLIYVDLLEGELVVNTPLKIPGCLKCKKL
ncbi:hypothetical protein [Sulfurisphaera ohwakuensis]|uniref:Uncharacterized protein n=1 Tax=Sulfurisphaera ohwakuensis TaxID=69656 RepID=A0A650CFA7_SULOH|nr:hypothetical protein [Sulfurisphaera ohwakuensis]MBB5254344.1 hypothetical protein [Sulfurisphaera ohwakuensis]QGR16436.1 hypothetical protein D1869_03880 [Sulfurisphaera ohwakuensis]